MKINRIKIIPWTRPLQNVPVGLKLRPHQIEAIKFALGRTSAYLGLDPGLGKAIVATQIARNFSFTVLMTPPGLIENIREEFNKWAPELTVGIFAGRQTGYVRPRVLLVPDSVTGPVLYYFLKGINPSPEASVLIIDEAHRFNIPAAARTQCVLGDPKKTYNEGIVGLFQRVYYMSGTPRPNRTMELFPILNRSAPETIGHMSYWDFGKRYCDGKRVQIGWGKKPKFAWDFKGDSNLKELARRIMHPHGPFLLRMRKDRIKLPPKIEEIFVFSRTMAPRLSAIDKKIGEAYEDIEDLVKQEISGKTERGAKDLHIATYRRLLGMEKVKAAVEYIQTLLRETQENLLIFAQHTDVIEALAMELMDELPIVITGQTDKKIRHRQVKDFQANKSRLMLANYNVMGVGHTLTAATRVIFVEFAWNPAVNEQAGDRAHRIGQESTVYIQYMVYKDSVDKKVIEALIRKREGSRHI